MICWNPLFATWISGRSVVRRGWTLVKSSLTGKCEGMNRGVVFSQRYQPLFRSWSKPCWIYYSKCVCTRWFEWVTSERKGGMDAMWSLCETSVSLVCAALRIRFCFFLFGFCVFLLLFVNTFIHRTHACGNDNVLSFWLWLLLVSKVFQSPQCCRSWCSYLTTVGSAWYQVLVRPEKSNLLHN